MSLRKRCSRTPQASLSAQNTAPARRGTHTHSKNTTLKTLSFYSLKHRQTIYFHKCCAAFGYGSTAKDYGHEQDQTEAVNWADWPQWLSGKNIKSQDDLEQWIINESAPFASLLGENAFKVYVYCNPRKSELMRWTPTKLVEHILKLESAGEKSDSTRAATDKTTRKKSDYSPVRRHSGL